MFDTLSNAMLPKPKKQKVTPSATAGNAKALQIKDITQNLPTFDLNLIEYDTIDDKELAKILDELPLEKENTNNNNSDRDKEVALPVQKSNAPANPNQNQYNTQVINQNIPFNMPHVPAMYFPNSNVTINYNFNK